MKTLWLAALSTCAILTCNAAEPLPRSTPEAEGISSKAILDFIASADKRIDSLHSFMLVRHDKVVAEGWWAPYRAQDRHVMFSLSKSFTSTAVGLAISEGKLSLDDQLLKFFPEDAPANPDDNLKAMRIRDLLCMSSGQHADDVAKFSFDSPERLTKLFLSLPVAHKPGTFFFYNTPGTYMLSATVQKVTGQTVLDYLRPRLFDPLGIENPTWDTSPQGISLGGYGLSIRTEDIARFGLLYLHQGNWRGKQLVPADWVKAATTRQTSNGSNPDSDWEQGYCYQFWRCRHGFFRGDGAFGQFCIVMPDQDAVIAITSGTKDLAGVLNLVWDKILPALQTQPLAPDADADKQLTDKLASLQLATEPGTGKPGLARQFTDKTYLFPTNSQMVESISLQMTESGQATLVMKRDGKLYRLLCGHDAWMSGQFSYGTLSSQSVAASGAFTGDGVYTAKICFNETPFVLTVTLKFSGDRLIYDAEYNVTLRGSTKQPELIGQMKTGS